jgi:hypothetical protein
VSVTMIGLDTAKSVFQIHGVNEAGKVGLRRKVRRSDLVAFFEKQERCTVVMEACGAAHHWARILSGLGHTVKLIAPEAVKPFVKKGKKNDAADAAAICEAASRPDVKFVPAKTVKQQAILAVHTARALLVKQQTMLANAIRGLATEFGHVVPKGLHNLEPLLALIDADEAMPEQARQAIAELHKRLGELAKGIQSCEAEIVKHARIEPTASSGNDPWDRSDHRLADRGNSGGHQPVQDRAAVRRLAWPGAAAELDRRQDPPRPDHQGRQQGDPQAAGAGGNVDGWARRGLAQRARRLAQRYPAAPPREAGYGGAGQQDGAHCLGGDDAQRGLSSAGRCRG